MKTIKIQFEINVDHLLNELKDAGKHFDLTLKKDVDLVELQTQLQGDIENDIDQRLGEFLYEGLNADIYTEFFEGDEW